jgi:hypothetical protein
VMPEENFNNFLFSFLALNFNLVCVFWGTRDGSLKLA